MTDWTDMVGGAAKGAAAGAMLGPVGAGVGGLLGVAMNVAPSVAQWLGGSAKLAEQAAQAVQNVTGATTPDAATAALAANPTLSGDLHVQLVQIANDYQAEENRATEARQSEADAATQNARQTTVALAQTGSPIAWGAPVVSVLVVLAFGGAVTVILFHGVPEGAHDLANVLLGGLTLAFGQVVNYWLGSSAGSARKDARFSDYVKSRENSDR